MKRTREQKKVDLMSKAEEMIEQLLDWGEQTSQPNMTQIEDQVLKLRKDLGQEMAQALLDEQDEKTPVPGPACPKCGKEMHYKGQRKKHIESRAGRLEVKRGYYACVQCGEAIFPPGSPAGTERQEME
jgi:YgiT-type zinc finger domain-containing protein